MSDMERGTRPIYRVTVPSKPEGKGRPRATKTGHLYTPKQTVVAENWVRLCCVQQVGTPCVKEPVRVTIEAVVAAPAKLSRREREEIEAGRRHPTAKPDLDNVVKLVLDALNGIAWSDDSRVVEVRAVKRFGPVPCVVVEWGAAPVGGAAAGLL